MCFQNQNHSNDHNHNHDHNWFRCTSLMRWCEQYPPKAKPLDSVIFNLPVFLSDQDVQMCMHLLPLPDCTWHPSTAADAAQRAYTKMRLS